MTVSACYRFRSDCSYSLVPASAGGSPPPLRYYPFFPWLGQRNRRRPVPVPVTGVRYNSLLWMCTLNTDLTWWLMWAYCSRLLLLLLLLIWTTTLKDWPSLLLHQNTQRCTVGSLTCARVVCTVCVHVLVFL